MQHSIGGRLVRKIPVRLVDFSLTGCSVATDHVLESGVVGELRIVAGQKEYHDTVQFVRSTKQVGRRHAFTLAGQFAWANRPGTASLRGEVPSLPTTS